MTNHQMVHDRYIKQFASLNDRSGDSHVVIIYMENLFDTLYVSR